MRLSRFIPALSAAMLMIFMLAFGSANAENLLENGDFSLLDEENLPEFWYTDAYIQDTGYSVFQVAEDDKEHPHAVSIQNIGENDARFAQTVAVEPDSLYLLSGFIRAEGVEDGHGANLSIEGVYAFSQQMYETDGQWQYVEYYGETGPEQDEITVFARLGGYSGESTGKAYFADISLTKVNNVPGDTIADLWYRENNQYVDEDEDYGDEDDMSSGSFRILLMISGIYVLLAAGMIYRERQRNIPESENKRVGPALVVSALALALVLRMMISWFVEGYMVDVNCFLSWGQTMASVGPTRFYEATSFCDYPPLYTYVLALNSLAARFLGGGDQISRVVFRFIPSLCDVASAWLLYRMLIRLNSISRRSCFLFLIFSLFNPAIIINSAAWGQMDSVLCMLILAVSLSAVNGKWRIALPLYVVAVLVKPQALMLGPLGLTYIILSFARMPESRKPIMTGIGFSFLVLAAGVIPFSIGQSWDWMFRLYGRTLASYPYATVNTANFYYLLGGNWSGVEKNAHILAPVFLCILSAGYGCWWFFRAKDLRSKVIETIISCLFSLSFILCTCLHASWAWCGGLAMAFSFVIVLSHAVRSGRIIMLPWLGGVLYILLYVFGVKMHERYVFPAFLLLCFAWILLRDRRVLYTLLLFTFTVFMNEGIVLDNSIRLGSSLGHLNSDTVWIADMLSVMNVIGSVYTVRISVDLLCRKKEQIPEKTVIKENSGFDCDRHLHWNRKDTILLTAVTAVYAIVSLLTLGSMKAPQTGWTSSSAEEQIVFDLGRTESDFEILYFSQVSRDDFSVSVSIDNDNWAEETWAQMDQGQCWKWKYVTYSFEDDDGERNYYNSDESHIIRFSGRYVRITSHQLGLKLNELIFRDAGGNILPATIVGRTGAEPDSDLFSDPAALLDEQDTMEGLPSFPANEENTGMKAEPSWWNSTYFDEIYHARTAYEFLQGTVPYETSHPPLGKILMSLSVAVFGMTPFGWRFAGAVTGILMIPGMYLLGKQLTKKTGTAALACGIMALDCMHLTQTQIATIDSFPVLFIIFSYFFMLRFIQTDYMKEDIRVSLTSLGFSGLFMGLSIASKWIGIYAGVGLAVLYFWHCYRICRLHGVSCSENNEPAVNIKKKVRFFKNGFNPSEKRVIVLCCWCVLFFVVVPVTIYLLSYIPYFAYNAKRIHSIGDYISLVWRAQEGMFNYHSTPNLGMDHPFYSPWWEWPVIGKPMYYASQQYIPADSPVHHSIFCFGNPVIWFGGLATMGVCLLRALKERRYHTERNDTVWHLKSFTYDPRYVFIILGLMAQYLPWVLVPRGTYIYHYFASLPFLMASVSLSFDGWREKWKYVICSAAFLYIIAAAGFFILLFPYASGMNVPSDWLDIGRTILKIWY